MFCTEFDIRPSLRQHKHFLLCQQVKQRNGMQTHVLSSFYQDIQYMYDMVSIGFVLFSFSIGFRSHPPVGIMIMLSFRSFYGETLAGIL